jgi:hypothetical protein
MMYIKKQDPRLEYTKNHIPPTLGSTPDHWKVCADVELIFDDGVSQILKCHAPYRSYFGETGIDIVKLSGLEYRPGLTLGVHGVLMYRTVQGAGWGFWFVPKAPACFCP